MFIYSFIN